MFLSFVSFNRISNLHAFSVAFSSIPTLRQDRVLVLRRNFYAHRVRHFHLVDLWQAGPKMAAILSLVESCRRLKVPVREYLAAVLPGLADRPIQRLPDLTPVAWVAEHS